MKIKLKIKHLVYILASLIWVVLLTTKLIIPNAEFYFAEKKITSGKIENKQEILELLSTTPIKSKKWGFIEKYMIGGGAQGLYDVYISPTLSTGGIIGESKSILYFTQEEKLPFLIEYVEKAPTNYNLIYVAKQLSLYYERNGDLESAIRVLSDASKRFPKSQSYQSNELLIERINLLENHGLFEEADQYIEEFVKSLDESELDMYAQVAQIRADMLLQTGEIDKAIKVVSEAIMDYAMKYQEQMKQWDEVDEDEISTELENMVYYEQLKTFKQTLETAKENNSKGNVATVSGKIVRSDGEPVVGAGVYLRDKYAVNRSVGHGEKYQVITDDEGYFEFKGVIPNSYQIAVGFYYDQISGWTWSPDMDDWIDVDGSKNVTYDITLQKLIEISSPVNNEVITDEVVRFVWEEVDGAAYYDIGLGYEVSGGSHGFGGIASNIKGNSVELKVEEIYKWGGGIIIGPEDLEFSSADSLLGFTNPNNRFFWNVTAYDENGRKLTVSNGTRLDEIGNTPFFYLKNRELTKADLLLLENSHEEALEQYLTEYEANPDDLHSLQMIIRLIGLRGDNTLATRDKLVLPYLKDLARKSDNPDSAFSIAYFYYEQFDWKEFNHWIDYFFTNGGELTNDYMHSVYASALMMQGKHEEADKEFELAMKKGLGNRFVGHWIANELSLNGLTERAKEIAAEYPERAIYEEAPNWGYLVSILMEEKKRFNSVEYEEELRQALMLYYSGKKEELQQWFKSTDKAVMRNVIQEIQNVY